MAVSVPVSSRSRSRAVRTSPDGFTLLFLAPAYEDACDTSRDSDSACSTISRTPPAAGKESVILECQNTLRRLGTDYIDMYQIHWPDVTTPIDETFEDVLRLKEQGKIREAGVSNYNVEQM